MCLSVAGDAHDLGAIVDSLGADSGELLRERWEETSRAVASVRGPAEKTGPALESMSDILELVIALGEFYAAAQTSVDALSADPDTDGSVYIPWTVVRYDWENARDLRDRIIEEPKQDEHEQEVEMEGEEHEGEEGENAEGHEQGRQRQRGDGRPGQVQPGEIVFTLVDAGLLGKTDEDSLSDFDDVYDFGDVFDDQYDWNMGKARW